jgi:protein ImuA
MPAPPRNHLLADLRQRIRQLEARPPPAHASPVGLGIPALEDGLPDRRLAPGSLVELLSAAAGAGVWTLALFLARNACGPRKVLVVVDGQACFYPPAAVAHGVDLDRLIVIHPRTPSDAALAVDQSLRAPAVGSVLSWHDRLAAPAFRRLQLAAEIGGGLGLLLRPGAARRSPSFAALRLLVAPVADDFHQQGRAGGRRRMRLDVLRCHGGREGKSLILEIDDATGDVRVPAGLAPATLPASAARASG